MDQIAKIVNLFRRHSPWTPEQIMGLGTTHLQTVKQQIGSIRLHQIGMGSFRRVYRINDLPLVVKCPNGPDAPFEECVEHSNNEMDIINRIKSNSKFANLRKYLPKVYYWNPDGVILMHEYKASPIATNRKICKQAALDIEKTLGKEFDLYKNFSVNDDGQIVLLDWGLLGDLSDWYQDYENTDTAIGCNCSYCRNKKANNVA